jgi:hypothetical protein
MVELLLSPGAELLRAPGLFHGLKREGESEGAAEWACIACLRAQLGFSGLAPASRAAALGRYAACSSKPTCCQQFSTGATKQPLPAGTKRSAPARASGSGRDATRSLANAAPAGREADAAFEEVPTEKPSSCEAARKAVDFL